MKQEVMDQFVSSMTELLKNAKDFTLEQAPQVAKEILAYEKATSIVWLAVFALFFAGAYMAHRKIQDHLKEHPYSDIGILYVLIVIGLTVNSLMSVGMVCDLVKAYVAPRLFLLEYFAHLIKH